MHTDRCTFAKSNKKKCKCSCKGILHGVEPIMEIKEKIEEVEEE